MFRRDWLGSKLQGQCLVNEYQYDGCLSRLFIHAKKKWSQWITLFEIASQRSTSQAYWVTLALISNIANYVKYNYFWDCDGIDNVTLRLWKFSDFCSRHIVGVAGDDSMFHILVLILICVCILSSFHHYNHHLSPNSHRLMFLFVDCGTVNKIYLILTYLIYQITHS